MKNISKVFISLNSCITIPIGRWLVLLVLALTAMPAGAGAPPNFDIGDITPQVIWQGNTAEFYVRSDELGSGATFTFVASPAPVGAMALDPVSGHFTCTPAAQDKEHFTVTIQASKAGQQPVWQVVSFDPMPHLPAEQEVFGFAPTHPMPDAASVDYIVRSDVLSDLPESFNYVTRQTRTVSISGKTVILEQGNANGLYDSYNGSDDIKTFNVYAETVVVRDALRLPQTAVTVYARELRFEDRPSPAAKACVNTTPRSLTTSAAQFQNGQNGLSGGNIAVQVQSVYSASGYSPRFITDGGPGQAAGLGQPGAVGSSVGPVDCRNDYWCLQDKSLCPGITFVVIDWRPDGGGIETWGGLPGNGGDATSMTKAGDGGNGGYVYCNLAISQYVQFSGGSPGVRTITPGGIGGNPNPAYMIDEVNNIGCSPYYPPPGRDATASPGSSGADGAFVASGSDLSWLSPLALRTVVAHARDVYLYGCLDTVKATLGQYHDYLTNYQARAEWNALSQQWQLEFQQLQNEIDGMLYRLDSHLDYFGNPAGWVPMLSFEVNKLAFEGEIERAIRVLYLNYWVSHAASSLVQKSNALATARQKLKDEIDGYVADYNANVQLFPVLVTESVTVSNEVQQTQASLEQLEQQLIAQAQHIVEERHKPPDEPGWKKIAKVAGAAISASPVGQPYAGAIGTGLEIIANFDSGDPWSSVEQLGSVAKEFTQANLNKSVTDWQTQMARIDFHTIETNNLIANVTTLFDFAKPIADGVKAMQDKQKSAEAPKTEVEAELKQLEAGSPVFQGLVSKATELNVDMELLGRRISAALQDISSASEGITQDTLAIDGLNRGLAAGNAIIDHRAMVYLAEMDKRARGRLLMYHYYMAKAYEYRLLQAYAGELNLQVLFDRFAQIVQGGSGHELNASDFDALKAIYEEQLSTITANIFTIYNSNPPGLSAPLRFNFTAEQLGKLNEGQSITINLKEMGLFQATEENVRIVDLHVASLSAHVQGPVPSLFGYADVVMEHSGESKLSSGGHDYLFRHYNYLTANPITWMTRYDALDAQIDQVGPSAANESMLAALLSREGIAQTTENLLLYSRPAAWADIVVTKAVNTDNGSDIVLDDLRLEVVYDFVPKSVDRAVLEVLAPTNGLMPYVIVDSTDLGSRQDGRGAFRRNYSRGQAVSLRAPATYGGYRFAKWTDQYGSDLGATPTNRNLSLTLNSTAVARPNFVFDAYLYPSNGLTCTAGATNGTFQVTVGPDSTWSATTDVPWIAITSPVSGTNMGMIDYTVAASPDCVTRTGHVLVAGLSFPVTQAAGTGGYQVSPASVSVSAVGCVSNVNVLAGGGCPWTATKDAAWISFTSANYGSGTGVVAYAVAANPDCLARTGTVTVAGETLLVNQAGGSGNFSLSATQAQYDWPGGAGSVDVQCGIGCAWSAVKDVGWITLVPPSSGFGTGVVSYVVATNSDYLARTGSVTIAGQVLSITQVGGPPRYVISPSGATNSWQGGDGIIGITCGGGFSWAATKDVAWVTFTSPASGVGSGQVSYHVATNADCVERTGAIHIEDQVFALRQTAGNGNFSLSRSSDAFGPPGGSGSVNLTAGGSCSWTVVNTNVWITVGSGGGTGSATINYSVGVNPNGRSRAGSVVIAGQVLAVSQAGNDDFENRISISGTSIVVTGSSTMTTKQAGEPNHAGNAGGQSVWWSWAAPGDGVATISTLGSSFDTLLGVYTGGVVSNLTLVAANDDAGPAEFTSLVSFSALAETPYQIAVDGFDGAGGNVTLNLSFAGSRPRIRPPALDTNGLLQFTFSAMAGRTNFIVQASTDLRLWKPLTNITTTDALIQFVDPRSTNYPERFYRIYVP